MDAQSILRAWQAAQRDSNFYAAFERETGLTPTQVQLYFADWNKLPHEEAIRIAEKHGLDVKTGGFAAYLAERL